MATIRAFKPSFFGGEISPKFYSAIESPQHFTGCRELTNFNVESSGGIKKRTGSKFVFDLGTSRGACFDHSDFSTRDKYISLLSSYVGGGNGRCRTFKTDTNTITVVTISEDHNYDDADYYDDSFTRETMYDSDIRERVTWVVNKNNWPIGLVNDNKCRSIGTATDTLILRPFAYVATITYETGDLVQSLGPYYKSLTDANIGNPPVSSPAQWELLVRDGNNVYAELWPLSQEATSTFIPKIPNGVYKYENRIIFYGIAGTGNLIEGQAAFGSSLPQYSVIFRRNVTLGTNDDDPYLFIIFDEIHSLQWMVGKTNLFFGTVDTEYRTPELGGITPTNIKIEDISTYGSGSVALQIQDTVLFTAKDNKTLYAINFQDTTQEYVAVSVTTLYSHIFTDEIKYLKYQRLPKPILWIVLKNGECYAASYDRTVGLNAVSKLDITGTVDSIEIQDYEDREFVALVVKRGDNYHLEFIGHGDNSLNVYLDSYVAVDMTAITDGTVAGLDHLEGEEVYVYADGYVFGLYTVSGGEVTILDQNEEPYVPDDTYIYAGLPYTAEAETLAIEPPTQKGVGINQEKQVSKVTPYLVDTAQIKIADQNEVYTEVKFREATDPLSAPVPLFSGYKETIVDGGWDRQARVKLKSDLPLACNVVSLVIDMEVR